MRALLLACAALAVVSLALLPAAPGYDAWMWLLWGRELAGGALDTSGGPAFKPLPVAVCTLLAPLGDAAPAAWLAIARAGVLAALALAALLAHRLARRGAGDQAALLAGAAAAAALALTGSLLALSAAGAVEGLFVAAALGAVLAWCDGRVPLALALGAACALMRVEALPFLGAAALVAWPSQPGLRPWLMAGAVALPLAWLLPDTLASGEVLRSAERARVPNPGQPALADLPALESLRRAAGLALVPVVLGVLFLRPLRDRRALALAVAGAGWLLLVAAMAQAGFSGEERYALPGVATLTVAGAGGLARLASRRAGAPVALGALVLAALIPRLGLLPEQADRLAYAARLDADLERAVLLAGGRDRLLRCGRPTVGDYRGPLLAYRLRVRKREVVFEASATGVAFASRLSGERVAAPRIPGRWRALARAGTWRVAARCRRRAQGIRSEPVVP